MTAMIDRDQKTLWSSVKHFIEEEDVEKAKVLLKTTVEKSLRIMGITIPIVDQLDFNIPNEEDLEHLKEMDKKIRKEIKISSSMGTYEILLDYLMMISDMTNNPPLSYKRIVASILAKESMVRRMRIPGLMTPPLSVDAIDDISNIYYDDSIQGSFNQQLSDNKANPTEKAYYTTTEVAKKLGLSDQTIRNMCEQERFKGAYRSNGGHWRIPTDNFITSREQDERAEKILQKIDQKNKEVGDVDEFDL